MLLLLLDDMVGVGVLHRRHAKKKSSARPDRVIRIVRNRGSARPIDGDQLDAHRAPLGRMMPAQRPTGCPTAEAPYHTRGPNHGGAANSELVPLVDTRPLVMCAYVRACARSHVTYISM